MISDKRHGNAEGRARRVLLFVGLTIACLPVSALGQSAEVRNQSTVGQAAGKAETKATAVAAQIAGKAFDKKDLQRKVDAVAKKADGATHAVREVDSVPAGQQGGEALPGDEHPSSAPLLPARLNLYVGQAVVHRVPGRLKRVAVGNGQLLSAHTVGHGEIVLIGTEAGETNVHLWMTNGSQRDIQVSVSGIKGDSLAHTIRDILGDVPGLQVRPIGSNIVVTGADLDPGTMAKLEALKQVYPQLLNFTGVDPVDMRPMVMMDVQIMEFNKSAVEELGIRWDAVLSGPIGGLIRDVTTNEYFRVLPEGESAFESIKDTLPTNVKSPQGYFGIATTIGSTINLLMNRGKAWMLAAPKLSAKSGSNATFLVGGEVPIVIPTAFGATQVEFKEYGIRLNITPTVNSLNQISTSIMAEVSRIDPSVSVQGVPGFLTRRTETEINVHAGETIVLSGLLDQTTSKAVDKFPILGDIPILGKLFRSDGFRGHKTELVVFVTPRIVSPTSSNNLEQLRRSDAIRNSQGGDISARQKKLVD